MRSAFAFATFGCSHNSCAGELPRSASSHFPNLEALNFSLHVQGLSCSSCIQGFNLPSFTRAFKLKLFYKLIPHIPNIYTGSISQMPNMGVTLQSVPYHSPFTILVPTCPPKGKMTGETPEVRSDKREPNEER